MSNAHPSPLHPLHPDPPGAPSAPTTRPTDALRPPHRSTARRAALSALVAASSLAGLHSASALTAPPGVPSSVLTPTARDAGLTTSGGAYMGWSHRGVRGAQPLVRARTSDPASSPTTTTTSATEGLDVSHYQGSVDWSGYYSSGSRFAYIKATEGTTYKDPQFSNNYTGSYDAGLIRGAYHFARPDVSSGATQAGYFLGAGGGWSPDGKTLPGALDIEYNPYGASCYGLTAAAMVAWIQDFVSTYHSGTGRYPVIYSTYDWWSTCTGNSSATSATSPWWIARYSSTVGSVPAGAATWTIWQYTSSPLDRDRFNGDVSRLTALATG